MTFLFSRLASHPAREYSKVARDADQLIRLWGAAAHDRATALSSQEDFGFINTDRPGHWWSVRAEIGRRMGRQPVEPAVAAAPRAA